MATLDFSSLPLLLDLEQGVLGGEPLLVRRLSDLRGLFADEAAYEAALAAGDPVVYTVSTAAGAEGEGQLHVGLGVLEPGRIGDEYFMTKGHLHAWREAAEIYIGLRGSGCMLLEHEQTGETSLAPLLPNSMVYVPGFTAHRTVNTGDEKLVYLGIYAAGAGYDYLQGSGFKHVVVAGDGGPELAERGAYLAAQRQGGGVL